MFAQITVIAPGLLGSSVAQAARARGLARRIVIWARRAEVREQIAAQAWCDAAPASRAEAVSGAALVVIAAPVTQIVPLVREIAPSLPPRPALSPFPSGALVTDVGSVKAEICRGAHEALAVASSGGGSGEAGAAGGRGQREGRAHFVGAHPMAGSEKTGWEHGQADLFEGRTCFVTPLAEAGPEATSEAVANANEAVAQFWRALGSRVVRVAPEEHDEIVAHISHLPQALASTLCAALGRQHPDWPQYAGAGLRDTTRIAGSDPQLWRTIFEQNREAVLRALDTYAAELREFRDALARRDYAAVAATLAKGQDTRRHLLA
ncbi:prephenate dehydrogenase [Cephaloticoccus primus]|uniref:Prephenate dehydrogenase n=1 Tax=Cephaloticoccus primus TaxID=1548207 RepID=A0A139ST49_9BACT|nr:prephenate dehydrogenase/arogenate dehydrogenase family protein [Cephaloticoccus primus]KXU37694.1 prephenate dehydrogenase [Cephaloticoccus primus]